MYDTPYLRGFKSAVESIRDFPTLKARHWIRAQRDSNDESDFMKGRSDGFLVAIGEQMTNSDRRYRNEMIKSAQRFYALFKKAENPIVKRKAGLHYLRTMANIREIEKR